MCVGFAQNRAMRENIYLVEMKKKGMKQKFVSTLVFILEGLLLKGPSLSVRTELASST